MPAIYHGWYVVAAAFAVAFFTFGIGLYAPGVVLVALETRHGWPIADMAAAVTLYFLLGASFVFVVGRVFEIFGTRRTLFVGVLSMVGGLVQLIFVTQPWQVFLAFATMSAGWAAMSGAGINMIVAPWFQERRGLAVSLALTGASAGGAVIAPLLVLLIENIGMPWAVGIAAGTMFAVLIPIILLILRPRRADEQDRLGPAGSKPRGAPPSAPPVEPWQLTRTVRRLGFLSISVPFALGTLTLVGVLTHQLAYLSPMLGTVAAGWAVSSTTAAALVGRLATGIFIDRLDQRLAAGCFFMIQVGGLGILASATSPATLYLGCIVLGIALGNIVTLPGLLVQREFPKAHFARALGLVIGINQFTYAFGPWLVGLFEQAAGSYRVVLAVCAAINVLAALLVVSPHWLKRAEPAA